MHKELPGIQKNVSLADYTSFRIGGPARYFFEAKTKQDVIKAVKTAKRLDLPFFILGEGSNILVSDQGFDGLIIRVKNQELRIKNTDKKSKVIVAGAGLLLGELVNTSIENNLTGLEWAVGIPGTVGGAISGNAGAKGKSIADVVEEVEVFCANDLKIKNYKVKDCKFSYRDSIFKYNRNLIILSAGFCLKKGNTQRSREILKQILKERAEKIPTGYSAGCIFKNPTPHHFSQKSGGGSAGELIEKCGLKGFSIGGAKVSFQHANFIINTGKATAKDVLNLINLIKRVVKDKTGIKLQEEIVFLR